MARSIIGLDIGTSTIKAVEVLRDKKQAALRAAGYIPSPVIGSSQASPDQTQDAIIQAISRLMHDMKPATTDVVLSLPSSKSVTRIIDMPKMEEKELASSISWEAEQYIPWQLANVKIDYSIIETDDAKSRMKVLLAAAPHDLIESSMALVSKAGYHIVAIEPEILSTVRSMGYAYPMLENTVILSMGASGSSIGLAHHKELIFTKTYPIGGNTMTRAIAEELGFELNQAEQYKRTYGLDESKLEGKITKIITPLLSTIFTDLDKTIRYFKEQYPQEEISSLVVSGGTAKLPGLVSHIAKFFGLDSQLFNPFISLSVDPVMKNTIEADGPVYANSVGLAYKEMV